MHVQITPLRSTLDIPADKRRPMTSDESETFVNVYFMDREAKAEPIEQLAEKMQQAGSMPFGVELMMKRLAVFAPSLAVREPVLLFLVSISDSPGQVVMWAFYLVRRTRQLGRAISIDDIAQDFPLGFPTTDAMSELWDEQKGAPATRIDNRLDQIEEWSASEEPAKPEAEAEIDDPIVWLSFADGDRPEGERFLGVAIVRARQATEAARLAHELGINPGGEVAARGPFSEKLLPPGNWTDRLLGKAEATELAASLDAVLSAEPVQAGAETATDPVLTADRVSTVMRYCLFRKEECPADGSAPAGAVIIEGIKVGYGFHPGRLDEKRDEIALLLRELPEQFMAGGGWSFLNACVDRSGTQWGEHVHVDALMSLGLAVGLVSLLVPRELWDTLPGGMPYFSVLGEADAAASAPEAA